MQVIEKHRVPAESDSERIEGFIFNTFQLLPTRNSAKKAVKRNCVIINGLFVEPGERVKEGQDIELVAHEIVRPEYRLPIQILYEDNWLAIVEKPPGIRVNGNFFKTVENALIGQISRSTDVDALRYPKAVHRLDIPTGGLLLIAKTYKSLRECSKLFENRLVKKKYRAVVIGKPDVKGEITSPIDGRDAVTIYRTIETVPSLRNEWLTLVEIQPDTGRKHQIRKHFLSIGFPVLGDKEYGMEGLILKGKGLFLSSVGLAFIHPITMEDINISIDEPVKFNRLLEREERRWRRYQ